MVNERLLRPDELPESLWNQTAGTLTLPIALIDAYVRAVDASKLRHIGINRPPGGGPVGGLTRESANEHFAQAFDGSAARTMLALLDPKNEVGSTSDCFVAAAAGADLALTDAPCGAGAAALSLLTTIASLRAHGVLPRSVLNVRLIGGELSEHAVAHASALLADIRPSLEAQAIFVEHQFIRWDVTDSLSTSDLIKACVVQGVGRACKLLVVANFNGFLVKDQKLKVAQPQLNELFRYASGGHSFAIWIEPDMNRATEKGGLFSSVLRLFSDGGWRHFGKVDPDISAEKPVFTSSARFRLPLQPEMTARVGLAVMPIDLAGSRA
ncbi:MAG: hypothetical protein ABL916_16785 [Burkholderiaceae bacterium]